MSAEKAMIFISNRPHSREEDYFEKLSIAMDLFTHTWSLSVEIQFYFIVPFIFLIGHQLRGAFKYGFYMVIVEDRILNSRILIYFGNVSYALYLVHWPIYAYAKLVFKGNSYLLGASLALSVILAVIFYETYEKWYLKQSSRVIFLLILILCTFNEFLVRKDEIQDMMRSKGDIIELNYIGNHSGRVVIKRFPRLDALRHNMSFYDAQRMNTYWNQHDHLAPELQVPGCKRRYPTYWCDFKGHGTEYSIAMLGNSYVINHYKMFIQECSFRAHTISKEDEVGCEVLASPRLEVDNGGLPAPWAAHCARELNEYVKFIKDTKPDYAFVFTRFVAISEPYDIDENHLGNDTIYLEMKSQLSRLLPHIKKKLFLIDSFPRIKRDRMDDIIPDLRRGKTMEEINKYLYNPNGFERGRRRHAELIKNECQTKCELIDYVDAFWNKTMNAFQYFDAGGLLYFTSGYHLSAHGIEHVRPIYRKICDRL
uniref:Acyl_transf_3 domain-containing protein n=1 Tax=Caenorhabditis tropicalis TaxID=1561998 RepID=A0A1I7TSY5_9PELO